MIGREGPMMVVLDDGPDSVILRSHMRRDAGYRTGRCSPRSKARELVRSALSVAAVPPMPRVSPAETVPVQR